VKAIFSPGPSYSNVEVRKYAGWVHILDLYKEGLEELGYEVIVPYVDPGLIDERTTVSKILSYDVVAASQLPTDAELFLGPPGYSLAQIMRLKAGRTALPLMDIGFFPPQHLYEAQLKELQDRKPKLFLYVWNGADWWRDEQLKMEYEKFGQPYDLSPSWRWINRTALEMCDRVIACSPWVKGTHSKVVPEDKISIAHWGVDSEKFHPPEVEPEGFRVLFVGGDPIRKGLVYLLRATGGLEGVEIWIVGCTPLDGPPIQITNRVKIRQFGMVSHEEMVHIYQQCHVICLPTLEDGIALAIQEGMACGLVPVTSPETSEVFEHYVSGLKVDYRDVDQIKKYLEWLANDPGLRREMSRNARKLAETQTWKNTKEEFKDIIRRECG